MTGQFIISADVPREALDWGALGWLSHLLAILGPCVGEIGYELVDVSNAAPWNALRR